MRTITLVDLKTLGLGAFSLAIGSGVFRHNIVYDHVMIASKSSLHRACTAMLIVRSNPIIVTIFQEGRRYVRLSTSTICFAARLGLDL